MMFHKSAVQCINVFLIVISFGSVASAASASTTCPTAIKPVCAAWIPPFCPTCGKINSTYANAACALADGAEIVVEDVCPDDPVKSKSAPCPMTLLPVSKNGKATNYSNSCSMSKDSATLMYRKNCVATGLNSKARMPH